MTEINESESMDENTVSTSITEAMPENNETIRISNDCYLIIGFEVNLLQTIKIDGVIFERAYDPDTNTQDLTVEDGYGHSYFITVRNGKVDTFFSFGPGVDMNAGTNEQIQESTYANPDFLERRKGIDEYSGRRPGDTEYFISEKSQYFKFKINLEQLNDIRLVSNMFKEKVKAGEEKYTAYKNDTCAETAKQILDLANIQLPDGKGHVHTDSKIANKLMGNKTYVTPYSWFNEFEKSYGIYHTFINVQLLRYSDVEGNVKIHPYKLADSDHWSLSTNDNIFSNINDSCFNGNLSGLSIDKKLLCDFKE